MPTVSGPNYDNVMMPGGGGIRIPTEVYGTGGVGNPGATIDVDKTVTVNFGAAHADYTLKASETAASTISTTNANGAANVIFPAYSAGQMFVIANSSGQTITFKVTGKTGIAVATAKSAILFMDPVSLDIQRVTADTTANS